MRSKGRGPSSVISRPWRPRFGFTEVARGKQQYASLFRAFEKANEDANPELFRLALKLATGAGKTTVMATLIAWQAKTMRGSRYRYCSRVGS